MVTKEQMKLASEIEWGDFLTDGYHITNFEKTEE